MAARVRMVTVDVPSYPPAARGAAHGKALAREIQELFRNWIDLAGHDEREVVAYGEACWPYIQEFSPDSAEELTALAEAAGLPLMHIVALNCYDEVGLAAPRDKKAKNGHCTGAGDGEVMGQTWDCPLWYRPVVLMRVLGGDDESVNEVHLTFPGIIGGPCSNADGLAFTWYTVVPLHGMRQPGVPNPILLREAITHASTAQAATSLWAGVQRAGGTAFLAMDQSRTMWQFEGSPSRSSVLSGDVLTHANNYLAPDMSGPTLDQLCGSPWTERRGARIAQLASELEGEMTVESLENMLADRDGIEAGVSICEHAEFEKEGARETLAAIIFDTRANEVWYKPGRPDDPETQWLVQALTA